MKSKEKLNRFVQRTEETNSILIHEVAETLKTLKCEDMFDLPT